MVLRIIFLLIFYELLVKHVIWLKELSPTSVMPTILNRIIVWQSIEEESSVPFA